KGTAVFIGECFISDGSQRIIAMPMQLHPTANAMRCSDCGDEDIAFHSIPLSPRACPGVCLAVKVILQIFNIDLPDVRIPAQGRDDTSLYYAADSSAFSAAASSAGAFASAGAAAASSAGASAGAFAASSAAFAASA